ncbi:Jerky-like protein [Blattella germanica]|nr:Jerky-like protein [Blattella germanica]
MPLQYTLFLLVIKKMSEKRKRVVLSIQRNSKKAVNEEGSNSRNLSLIYNLGETTISDIRKNKEKNN